MRLILVSLLFVFPTAALACDTFHEALGELEHAMDKADPGVTSAPFESTYTNKEALQKDIRFANPDGVWLQEVTFRDEVFILATRPSLKDSSVNDLGIYHQRPDRWELIHSHGNIPPGGVSARTDGDSIAFFNAKVQQTYLVVDLKPAE